MLPDPRRRAAERLDEAGRWVGRLGRGRGEVQADRCSVAAAASVPLRVEKEIGVSGATLPVLHSTWAVASVACPHSSTSTTGVNHRRRYRPRALGHQESGLGQVHLRGDALHPAVGLLGQQADGRRVAGERPLGEGVDLVRLPKGSHGESITTGARPRTAR